MIAEADFAAWLRLLETPGIGRTLARRLLAACGSPQAVLQAAPATVQALAGPAAARALQQAPPAFAERLARALAWLGGGADRCVLALGDPAWPPLLLQVADPPLLLYVQGDVAALSAPSIAIVGSRQPSAQGRDNAQAFGRALAEQGWLVVSGLAQGIDAAAHEGALASAANPATVAVVGTGLDQVYPARHAELARRIAARGALVSEFAPGTPPLAEHFPQRNRLIAGLTRGTLVVEAALRSGSLITARLAAEAGREVFALPGSIHAPQSKGCHALIRQGAKLVETAEHVLEELIPARPPALAAPAAPPDPAAGAGGAAGAGDDDPADAPHDALLEALGDDPVTLDALLERTGRSVPELSAQLLEHELAGRVARLPGGLYQRRHAA